MKYITALRDKFSKNGSLLFSTIKKVNLKMMSIIQKLLPYRAQEIRYATSKLLLLSTATLTVMLCCGDMEIILRPSRLFQR